MKKITLFLASFVLVAALHADDQLRQVQQALKDQGFYYGEVDGEGGTETNAAIRRYQIRGGLEVTGKLNDQTLAALHLGGAEPPAVVSQPPTPAPEVAPEATVAPRSNVVESDKNFLRRQPPAEPETAVEPPQPKPTAPIEPNFAAVFQRTPFERAPAAVQRDTLRRAQVRLYREGFYRGEIDGAPGSATQRAIADYQRDADLPPTGRLDLATLADMNLLPSRRTFVPAPPPGYDDFDEPPPPGRHVYRGIWVH